MQRIGFIAYPNFQVLSLRTVSVFETAEADNASTEPAVSQTHLAECIAVELSVSYIYAPRLSLTADNSTPSLLSSISKAALRPKQSEVHMSSAAVEIPHARGVDMKLEVVVIPVSDVDRAERFYGGLGWRLDADYASDDGYFRVVQFHAARFRVFSHLRQERYRRQPRLRPGPVPDRLRRRGSPQRTGRSRYGDQRSVPRCHWRLRRP